MKLTLLSTSDTHGYIYPTDFKNLNENNAPFGVSRAASVIENERKNADGPVITIELGDFLQGSALATYLAKKNNSNIINAYNQIQYDFGLLGNHEFNYGQKFLKNALNKTNYPILCANITDDNNNCVYGIPYFIKSFNEIKVAFIGLTTAYIPHWESPEHIKNLKFHSIVKVLKSIIPEIHKKADIIIVCYHGGFERDIKTGKLVSSGIENEGYELLHTVHHIDALLTGHQHKIICGKLCDVPVTQPGYRGEYVGKIVLDIQKNKDGKYNVNNSTANLIPTKNFTPKKNVLCSVHNEENQTENWLEQPIGKINGTMHINNPFDARLHGCPYITLINKIQMDKMQTDISCTSLFTDQCPGFNSEITMRDILMNYIYTNSLVSEKITGTDLKAALEKNAKYFTINNGKIEVDPNFGRSYNYDIYEGINYVIDIRKPFGNRVVKMTYHNHDIKPNESLTLALCQYRGVGGGNYNMFSANKIIKSVNDDMMKIIADYIKKHSPLIPQIDNNFIIKYN